MKKSWKIKNLITTTLALMSTTIAAIFLIFIANYQINIQKENLVTDLNQLSDTVIYNINAEFNKMNQASLSILYSTTIRNSFYTYTGLQTGILKSNNNNNLYSNTKTLNDMVYSILTGKGIFSKITLYNPTSGSYTFGPYTAYINTSIKEKFWYQEILDNPSGIITSPYKDPEFSSKITYNTDREYISLIRPYYSGYNTIEGYVEVVQNYDIIFNVLSSIEYDPAYKIVILDSHYNSVNHVDQDNDSYEHYVNNYLPSSLDNNMTEYTGSHKEKTQILHLKDFNQYDYKCLIIIDKNTLYQPIYKYLKKFILLSLIIIIVVILLSLFISKFITEPIYHLYTTIKNADITDKNSLADTTITTNILELNALWVALVNSHSKLRDSMNQLIMVEQREVQSQMIALQSQMNPHFLYNSLSVLDSIIDKGQTDNAKAFCMSLSSMLRYVSSTGKALVNLEEELEQTHTYLECMTFRYGDDLSFSFDIPDTMLYFLIPKLTVQTLIENATKYATLKHAPWHINIRSYIDNHYWYVQVSDNGYGFEDKVIKKLEDDLKLIKSGEFIPHQSLDGMGLLNLLSRIKLHCKSNPYLKIENIPDNGCIITIGGKIIYEEDFED